MKRPAIVLALILFLALAWAAVVTFFLATNLWTGAVYSLAGGLVIGLGIAYLLKRWWFRGIQRKEK